MLSTNSKEFVVEGTTSKLPRDTYAKRRLVYLNKFSLRGAKELWSRADSRGWPTPQAPGDDPRRREAQKLLAGLSDAALDTALAELRRLGTSPS